MKWAHVLGMISVRWIVQPEKYVLYYDRMPPDSPQWRCARVLATEIHQRRPVTSAPGSGRRIRMAHWPEMMRYDVLLEHGGIFLDHDAYALRPLDKLRSCCAPPTTPVHAQAAGGCDLPAAVVSGIELLGTRPSDRRLNPGALLAERGAMFLQAWRASW